MKIHCKQLFPCGLIALLSLTATAQVRFKAENGVLDAREWNFNEKLPLAGYWMFYPNQLLTVTELLKGNGREHTVPALWNDVREDGSGKGFGTYALFVVVPKNIPDFSLEVPQLYNAFQFYVNGLEVARAGAVGQTPETTTPAWRYQFVKFPSGGVDTLKLVLQIANFHHAKGGIKDQIFLGVPNKTEPHFTLSKFMSKAESSLLVIIGLVFVILYFVTKRVVALYFALLCMTWSVRTIFSNLYVAADWFPNVSWNLLVRIEYVTLFLAVIFAAAFLHHLFLKAGVRPFVTYTLVAINVVFILFTLIASPAIFSKSVTLFVATAGLTVIYGALMVIRALLFEYAGAWFLMASILTGVAVFGYDIIAYQGSLAPSFIFLSVGYMLMFSLVALGLLFHLNLIKGGNKGSSELLTYEDMMGK